MRLARTYGAILLGLLVSALYGWHSLATLYVNYDDEGYLLVARQHFVAGGQLYTQVFSQYGPFYFFVEGAFFRLFHLPVTHDTGRLLTSIFWAVSSVIAGMTTYRLSRSITWAVLGGMAMMRLTTVLAAEPGHPQEIVLLLLVLGCYWSTRPQPFRLALLGSAGAALALTKINVGVFYFAAVFETFICVLPRERLRTIAAGLALVYAAAFPIVLMHHDLGTWAGGECFIAILSGVTTLLAGLWVSGRFDRPLLGLARVLAGAAVAAVVIVLIAMMGGLPFRTLVNGVLIAPLGQVDINHSLLGVTRADECVAVVVCVGALAIYRFRSRWRNAEFWINFLRCAVGVYVLVRLVTVPTLPTQRLVIFLPLGLLPTNKEQQESAEYFPRLFITMLAATQFLQTYPVAGSQRAISMVPVMFWALFCTYDGAVGLTPVIDRRFGERRRRKIPELLRGAMLLALCAVMLKGGIWRVRLPFPGSSLPGTKILHFTPDQENLYRSLAENVAANCDMLFTMPGMGSLNLWSGVQTPNGLHATVWISAFTMEQQTEILRILERDPQACVVYNPQLVDGWDPAPVKLQTSPLVKYIYSMPETFANGSYHIRVNPSRRTRWVTVNVPPQKETLQSSKD